MSENRTKWLQRKGVRVGVAVAAAVTLLAVTAGFAWSRGHGHMGRDHEAMRDYMEELSGHSPFKGSQVA